MSCLIVGDSIAVGLAALLNFCAVDAAIGIPSADVIGRVRPADTLIVSAGSNDPYSENLGANLRALRGRATGRVIWVLPANQAAREIVVRVANERRDRTVRFAAAADAVHPRAYGELAAGVCGW